MLPRNADLSLLAPIFRQKLELTMLNARKAGLAVHLFEGQRSPERQDELFAMGRTYPGTVVTNAKAWESWHQYALAGDLAFDGDPATVRIDWTWNGNWKLLGAIGEKHGLTWFGAPGSPFREAPHFQYTAGLPIREAFRLKSKGGLPMVWAEVARLAAARGAL